MQDIFHTIEDIEALVSDKHSNFLGSLPDFSEKLSANYQNLFSCQAFVLQVEFT